MERQGCKPFRFVVRDAKGEEVADHGVPIEFLPGPAERLVAVAPASVHAGQSFEVQVRAEDAFGNPIPRYRGTVHLGGDGLLESDASSHRFAAKDRGVYRFRSLRLKGTEVARLRVRDKFNGIGTTTNPIVAVDDGDLRVFFGDLHVHSGVSGDSSGSMDELLRFAQHTAGLDFAGSSNHDMDLTAGGGWGDVVAATRTHDVPDSFVAFLGYEWTSQAAQGHRNVVFPGLDGEVFAAQDSQSDTPDELWQLLKPFGALTIPHLPMSRGRGFHHQADWQPKDEGMQRLVEIYSQWTPRAVAMDGVDIETSPNGVQDAWRQGHRLGLVGGSDNHAGHPGETGGLTAILATALDRESLWEGLLRRRCYATTGARIWLDFRMGNHLIGEEVAIVEPEPLHVTVHGTAPLERVELIRLRGETFETVHTEYPEGLDLQFDFLDPDGEDASMYYVRVFQKDGHRAWSSPVWITGGEE